jgi:hypothetical protein
MGGFFELQRDALTDGVTPYDGRKWSRRAAKIAPTGRQPDQTRAGTSQTSRLPRVDSVRLLRAVVTGVASAPWQALHSPRCSGSSSRMSSCYLSAPSGIILAMLWFFERDGEVLKLETRVEQPTGAYVLVIDLAGRPTETERFLDYGAFQARLSALEARLQSDRWVQAGEPSILQDGWRTVEKSQT